ncbi:hypothetical protein [Streptomyces sp. RTGN2]|uniref:hypothetical protein n=1 Tax=Streptomyces sp. RTGN2 TaxID=3016525 RepID=UPI002556DDCF|nr:hypothetical protein [Streptomyces sp. RTGN2]
MTSIPDGTRSQHPLGSNERNGGSLKASGVTGVLVVVIYVAVLAGRWDVVAALLTLVTGGPVVAISVVRGCRTSPARISLAS